MNAKKIATNLVGYLLKVGKDRQDTLLGNGIRIVAAPSRAADLAYQGNSALSLAQVEDKPIVRWVGQEYLPPLAIETEALVSVLVGLIGEIDGLQDQLRLSQKALENITNVLHDFE